MEMFALHWYVSTHKNNAHTMFIVTKLCPLKSYNPRICQNGSTAQHLNTRKHPYLSRHSKWGYNIHTYQGFFPGGGLGGPPIWQKFCQSPHPTLVLVFGPRLVSPSWSSTPNFKILNTFLCQIWLLLSSKVPFKLYFMLKIAKNGLILH